MVLLTFAFLGFDKGTRTTLFDSTGTTQYLESTLEDIQTMVGGVVGKVLQGRDQIGGTSFLNVGQTNGTINAGHGPANFIIVDNPTTGCVVVIARIGERSVSSTSEKELEVVQVVTGLEVEATTSAALVVQVSRWRGHKLAMSTVVCVHMSATNRHGDIPRLRNGVHDSRRRIGNRTGHSSVSIDARMHGYMRAEWVNDTRKTPWRERDKQSQTLRFFIVIGFHSLLKYCVSCWVVVSCEVYSLDPCDFLLIIN